MSENLFRNKSAEMKVAVKCNTANKMDVIIHEMQHAVDDCHDKNKQREPKTTNGSSTVKIEDETGNRISVPAYLIRRMKTEIPAYSRADVMRDGKSDKDYHDELFGRVMGSVLVDIDEAKKDELSKILRIVYNKLTPDEKEIKTNYKSKK